MNRRTIRKAVIASLLACVFASDQTHAQIAVKAKTIHTMSGAKITDGVVLVRDGKIAQVGRAADVAVPEGFRIIEAAVVTPGLIDARSTVGVSGIFNTPHDQDQLERSSPIQPELRAIDAYNPQEKLVEYVRGFGITTLHTGHAPGELISGQTCIVKTTGNTVEDAVMVPAAMVAATLGPAAQKEGDKSPGTRAKSIAMLREQLIKAQEYMEKSSRPLDDDKHSGRDLRMEMLGRVLKRELPLLITANRAQDITSALRLAEEFGFKLVLDSAAEAYLLTDEIKGAGVPVIVHPTMWRAWGETENLSVETASKLRAAGIPVALQSGFESYVPKSRIVLFEAAVAAANGLTFEQALATVTIDAAKILGIADRVGSIEPGKDADLAMFDADPFEYTSHCTGTIINGVVVSETPQ